MTDKGLFSNHLEKVTELKLKLSIYLTKKKQNFKYENASALKIYSTKMQSKYLTINLT